MGCKTVGSVTVSAGRAQHMPHLAGGTYPKALNHSRYAENLEE
jgi:hypothetical protein